jgi:hypothetical protein
VDFPALGRTQQTDIGQHPEFKVEPAQITAPPGYGSFGGTIGAALEASIAITTISPLGDQEKIIILDQIANQFTGIPIRNQSTFRHGYNDVITTSAGTVATTSPLAALSSKRASEPKIGKRVEPGSRLKIDTAPLPPSPPSGPPRGTYFSRRKLRQPLPPFPACTVIVASSTNFII